MHRVSGILETALSVKDLAKSADFYRRLFQFETLLESERLVALNVAGKQVLLLFLEGTTEDSFTTPGGVIPGHGGHGRFHLAFSISADDAAGWKERLAAEDIAVESVVNWPGNSQSIYFRDPDEHLVELMTPGFWSID